MLFDELLSPKVARALRELGFNTSHVGHIDDASPARGSLDEQVLAHAKRHRQVVVTSNHDMILLCHEQAESVVWIDPRGRQFTLDDLALVAFKGIRDWQRLLQTATGPVCVRVLRTKVERLSLERAAALARQRIRRLHARKAKKKPRPRGPMFPDD